LSALLDRPLTIYGDGYQVRDALHVSDAVDAWLGALDRIGQVQGRVFNLGGGPQNSVSLLELIDLIARLTRKQAAYSFADLRPGDQPWYVSDTRALSSTLGWQPRISLGEGIGSLQQWLVERFGQYAGIREVPA
jgi:CDP-paratose 2-epimerase